MRTWVRFEVTAVGKVRMSQQDKWKKRPVVLRYRAYQDRLRELCPVELQPGDSLAFGMPMPPSWSAKKRAAHVGKPHRSKPDLDNLVGGVMDALMPEDKHLWALGGCAKMWCAEGFVAIGRREPAEIEFPL